jgi:hypothetical protein
MIEVDESDQVFVVKGREGERGGYHELGVNDIIVLVQQVTVERGEEVSEVIPHARIYLGGTVVPLVERFSLVIDQSFGNPTQVGFIFMETFPYGNGRLANLVSRLNPYITVQVGNNGSVVPGRGGS